MGAQEIISCGWCCGTGWTDIYLGAECLRAEIAGFRARTRFLIYRDAVIKSLEEIHDDRNLNDDERDIAWRCILAAREAEAET